MKVFYLTLLTISILLVSCSVKNYHGTVTVYNSCTYTVYYNVYKLSEDSSLADYENNAGKSVIDVLHGDSSPLAAGKREDVDVNWAGQNFVYVRASAGNGNAYQTDFLADKSYKTASSSPPFAKFQILYEGATKVITISHNTLGDNTTDINIP